MYVCFLVLIRTILYFWVGGHSGVDTPSSRLSSSCCSSDFLLLLVPISALLVVETETFGSHIRIKGKESDHYICMNEKGKIVGRVSIFLRGEWEEWGGGTFFTLTL